MASAAGLDLKFMGEYEGRDAAQLIDPMTVAALREHDVERKSPCSRRCLGRPYSKLAAWEAQKHTVGDAIALGLEVFGTQK